MIILYNYINDKNIELNFNSDALSNGIEYEFNKNKIISMNIYVDNNMTPLKFKNRDDFGKRRGIAIEPQRWLFDRESITLRKGEKYSHYIDYKFKETK